MRAREFITEQAAELPDAVADPMRYTYVLPGVNGSDPYGAYRLSVAMARARSDAGQQDGVNDYMVPWTSETAFGEHAVVAGMDEQIIPIIDQALKMTGTPGGKRMVSTPSSDEPNFVDTVSPVKSFKGYPR
jgi:hypothetical protein